ncbi:MAG TPA: hypothetical protein DCY20_01475 [Firmicutes bacterium]|nr:hypothetical protein [Bacillota bacterium]
MEILDILNKQIDMLKNLLDLLKKEHVALKDTDSNVLAQIVNLKEELVYGLNEVECARYKEMGDMTLKQFVQGRADLNYLVDEYKEVMDQINYYQELNQQLATLTYTYSKDMLGALLTSAKEKSITYGRKGNMYSSGEVKTTMMNRKV